MPLQTTTAIRSFIGGRPDGVVISGVPVTVTDSTLSVDPDIHAGRTTMLSRAAGVTVTLPAATGTGDKYIFKVGVVPTSNSHKIQVANSTDIMQGSVFTVSDGAAAVLGYNTTSTSDTITLNGTTTGGLTIGDSFIVEDTATGVFTVTGFTSSSGTEATPFSAAV